MIGITTCNDTCIQFGNAELEKSDTEVLKLYSGLDLTGVNAISF